jgi:hypothetical protein
MVTLFLDSAFRIISSGLDKKSCQMPISPILMPFMPLLLSESKPIIKLKHQNAGYPPQWPSG